MTNKMLPNLASLAKFVNSSAVFVDTPYGELSLYTLFLKKRIIKSTPKTSNINPIDCNKSLIKI